MKRFVPKFYVQGIFNPTLRGIIEIGFISTYIPTPFNFPVFLSHKTIIYISCQRNKHHIKLVYGYQEERTLLFSLGIL